MNSPARGVCFRPAFAEQLKIHREKCRDCKLCVRECAFLQKYGAPGEIAESLLNGEGADPAIGYECSLCGLCRAVCPAGIDPAEMFLEARRESVERGKAELAPYKPLLNYEALGSSFLFTSCHLPEGCDTVLFPGCAFSGTRAGMVGSLFELLSTKIPHLGIVLDCCRKPSHDLGRQDHFTEQFSKLKEVLKVRGVYRLLVLCPSCHRIFSRYGDGLLVESAYEHLAGSVPEIRAELAPSVTVHDPCILREEKQVQKSVRELISGTGRTVTEMEHFRVKTLCCGEGGGVHFVNPELACKWTNRRLEEAGERQIVTYCAGCIHFLGKEREVYHVLDMFFESEAVETGRFRPAAFPFTYLRRLQLRNRFEDNSIHYGFVQRVIRFISRLLGKV